MLGILSYYSGGDIWYFWIIPLGLILIVNLICPIPVPFIFKMAYKEVAELGEAEQVGTDWTQIVDWAAVYL